MMSCCGAAPMGGGSARESNPVREDASTPAPSSSTPNRPPLAASWCRSNPATPVRVALWAAFITPNVGLLDSPVEPILQDRSYFPGPLWIVLAWG